MKIEDRQQKAILLEWVLCATVVVVILATKTFWGGKLPSEIPLWYSRPWGEEQLANLNWVLLIPAISLTVTIFSIFIVNKKWVDGVIGLMILWSGIVGQLILVLGYLRIFSLLI